MESEWVAKVWSIIWELSQKAVQKSLYKTLRETVNWKKTLLVSSVLDFTHHSLFQILYK